MRFLSLVLVLSILTSGCTSLFTGNTYTPFPLAKNFKKSYLNKLQSAAHWNILAENEADEISRKLNIELTVSIEKDSNESEFEEAYRKMLTSHLLRNGIKVEDLSGDYLLACDVQVVNHEDRDLVPPPAGSFTTLFMISQIPELAVAAIPFATDNYFAKIFDTFTPNTEVLITTEIKQGTAIIQSSTHVYYFNPKDEPLYDPGSKDRTYSVTNQI